MKLKKAKNNFFEELKEGLQEILDHQKGMIKLSSEFIELPKPPLEYKAKEIKTIRKNKNYSQTVFAIILNVSPKTIQSWESGIRKPSKSSLRLLEIIDQGIYNPQIYKNK